MEVDPSQAMDEFREVIKSSMGSSSESSSVIALGIVIIIIISIINISCYYDHT